MYKIKYCITYQGDIIRNTYFAPNGTKILFLSVFHLKDFEEVCNHTIPPQLLYDKTQILTQSHDFQDGNFIINEAKFEQGIQQLLSM